MDQPPDPAKLFQHPGEIVTVPLVPGQVYIRHVNGVVTNIHMIVAVVSDEVVLLSSWPNSTSGKEPRVRKYLTTSFKTWRYTQSVNISRLDPR